MGNLDLVTVPYPVILASGSPRRKELLGELFSEFEVVVSNVDEAEVAGESPWEMAERLATLKALAVHRLRKEAMVIGGDTVVAIQGENWTFLAKPKDHQDACRMLRTLSGREHIVVTGLCVVWPDGQFTTSDTTRVAFRDLDIQEIERYVAGGESMDKAGAYALQGEAAAFIERIDGSPSNVIGLPMEKLAFVIETKLTSCSRESTTSRRA